MTLKQLVATSEDEEPLLEVDDSEEEITDGGDKIKDPILDVIGNFGKYQLGISLVGLLQHLVHCWQSLCLKFVGFQPKFTCREGVEGGADHCRATWENGTVTDCTKFSFDEADFTNTIAQRWLLVCQNQGISNIAQSVFFAGCLVGVFVSGVLSDRCGRRPVMLALTLSTVMSGICCYLTTSIYVWLVSTFIRGASTIGATTVRFVIQIEMVGGKAKVWSNVVGGVGWVAGYMTLPVVAWLVHDQAKTEAVIALCMVPVLALCWCYPESPRWLLAEKRFEEAKQVIKSAAAWNNRDASGVTTISLQKYAKGLQEKIEAKKGTICDLLWLPCLRRNLIVICVCWFSIGMAYFGLALHTPEFGSNVFLVFFIGGLFDVPALVIAPVVLNQLGRRLSYRLSLVVGAAALLATTIVRKGYYYKEWPIIALSIFGKMCIGIGFDCSYIFTSELFPTVVRNSVLSTASSAARLGAIVAPLVAEIDESRPALPILLYGLMALVAGIQSYLLWPETFKLKKLPDTLEEGEELARRKKKTYVKN